MTSATYILCNPELTFAQRGTAEISYKNGECSANGPVLSYYCFCHEFQESFFSFFFSCD